MKSAFVIPAVSRPTHAVLSEVPHGAFASAALSTSAGVPRLDGDIGGACRGTTLPAAAMSAVVRQLAADVADDVEHYHAAFPAACNLCLAAISCRCACRLTHAQFNHFQQRMLQGLG